MMLGHKISSSLSQALNIGLRNLSVQNVVPKLLKTTVQPFSLFNQARIITQSSISVLDKCKGYSTSAVEPKSFSSDALPIQNVNHQLQNYEEGRLFATVHLCGKQFRVVEGDIIIVEGYWPPDIGDKISLDKVLLAGGSDFSLIGRPLVKQGLVKVIATVIEKTLSHTKTHFRKKRRKQYMRIKFYRGQYTMLRINSIEIQEQVNAKPQETPEIQIY